jgi:hypothetical protein
LELDYVPCQFIVRQSFLKGLVTVFDMHKFCEEKNNGNYLVKTIYKNENGENIYADLKDYDLIISESQFKLWDSYKGIEHYRECYHKNNIKWSVFIEYKIVTNGINKKQGKIDALINAGYTKKEAENLYAKIK